MITKAEIKKRNIDYIINDQDEALDAKYYKLISEVLHKLPSDVLEKLFLIEPQFIIMEKGDFGQSFPIKKMRMISRRRTPKSEYKIFDGETRLIILNDEQLDKCFLQEKYSVIAEELAHTYAGHGSGKVDDDDLPRYTGDYRSDLKTEREAAKLLRNWGFKHLNSYQIKKILRRKGSHHLDNPTSSAR